MEEHEITHEESLLYSVDQVLRDPPYNVRSSHKDAISRYDPFGSENMADTVALGSQLMCPEAHEKLFCFAVHTGEWNGMLYIAGAEEEKICSCDGETCTTREVEGRRRWCLWSRVFHGSTLEKRGTR